LRRTLIKGHGEEEELRRQLYEEKGIPDEDEL
jgi:hypothetical protein